MAVEAVVSLVAAWRANSAALLVFGGDSVIELLSAGLVLAASRGGRDQPWHWANRPAALLLLALAAAVVAIAASQLVGRRAADTSWLGIAVLVAAAVIMPWLAARKRRLAEATNQAALRADAVQSAVCGYLAWVALAGLLLHAALGWRWADPVAALMIVPLVLREARAAWRGSICACAP